MRVEVRLVSTDPRRHGDEDFYCEVAATCLRCGRTETGASQKQPTAAAAETGARADCLEDFRLNCPRTTEHLKLRELNAYEFTLVPEGVSLWCERLGTYYPLHLEGEAVAGAFGGLDMGQLVRVVTAAGKDTETARAAAELAQLVSSWGWPCVTVGGTPDGPERRHFAHKIKAAARREPKPRTPGVYRKPADQYAFDRLHKAGS